MRGEIARKSVAMACQRVALATYLLGGSCSGQPLEAVGAHVHLDCTTSGSTELSQKGKNCYSKLRASVRAMRRRIHAERQLRIHTAFSGDCKGRYPIGEVLEAIRGGGPYGANMVRVRWYGTNPVTLVPWGVGWERVSNYTADVRRLAALLMGPRPAHPTFVQCKPNVRSVAPALALGTRRSGRLALQAAARHEKIGRLRRSATQVFAAAEWDQWSFGGEADGSMRGKRKWRQIATLLDSDEET